MKPFDLPFQPFILSTKTINQYIKNDQAPALTNSYPKHKLSQTQSNHFNATRSTPTSLTQNNCNITI